MISDQTPSNQSLREVVIGIIQNYEVNEFNKRTKYCGYYTKTNDPQIQDGKLLKELGFDSLHRVAIAAELETKLNQYTGKTKELSVDKFNTFKTFGEMMDYLKNLYEA